MENVINLILLVPAILVRGWVLLNLWGWFIVPLGVKDITIAHALGISLLINTITPHETKDSSAKETAKLLIKNTIILMLALGLGWIFKSFM